jgi:predicted CopG family antitoxin
MRQGQTNGITIYTDTYDTLISWKERGESMAHLVARITKLVEPHFNKTHGKFGKKVE